jgi:hypothetical protein
MRRMLQFITPAVVYAITIMALSIVLIAVYEDVNRPSMNPAENYILEEYYSDDH